MPQPFELRPRAVAAGIHFSLSLVVATLAAILVFVLWYPGAYRQLAGGRDLFLLVTSVDVVLGPLLTFAVFNRRKPKAELRRDLAIIGLIQLAGLVYGLHTVYIVRPVAMVFEVDRLRMVIANDVATDELPKALPEYRSLPLTGPWLLAARQPEKGDESNDALFKGVGGVDISQRPPFWQAWSAGRDRVLAKSRPLPALLEHYRKNEVDLKRQLADIGADPATARFLPVMARGDFVAVIDARGDILGYLPLDGFF